MKSDEETGESILPMPKEVYGDYVEIDDVISFKKAAKHRIKLVNLSCKVVSQTRFTRQLNSAQPPLNRVILSCHRQHFLLKRPT